MIDDRSNNLDYLAAKLLRSIALNAVLCADKLGVKRWLFEMPPTEVCLKLC